MRFDFFKYLFPGHEPLPSFLGRNSARYPSLVPPFWLPLSAKWCGTAPYTSGSVLNKSLVITERWVFEMFKSSLMRYKIRRKLLEDVLLLISMWIQPLWDTSQYDLFLLQHPRSASLLLQNLRGRWLLTVWHVSREAPDCPSRILLLLGMKGEITQICSRST